MRIVARSPLTEVNSNTRRHILSPTANPTRCGIFSIETLSNVLVPSIALLRKIEYTLYVQWLRYWKLNKMQASPSSSLQYTAAPCRAANATFYSTKPLWPHLVLICGWNRIKSNQAIKGQHTHPYIHTYLHLHKTCTWTDSNRHVRYTQGVLLLLCDWATCMLNLNVELACHGPLANAYLAYR